jgi:hypothetical protein
MVRSMRPLAFAFAALTLGALLTSDPILLTQRKPIAFILSTPTGATGTTSSSDIIRIVSNLFETHTSLVLREIDAVQVADCKGKVGCMLTKIGVGPARKDAPELLLVLSKLTQPGAPDRLSAMLVDVTRAADVSQEVTHHDEDWENELETRIFESAVLVRPRFSAVRDQAETQSYLERLFTSELRGPFESRGVWEPYGSILIEGTEAGIAIDLDGTTIGVTRPASTRILYVLPGKRTLKLTSPKLKPYATDLQVERGREATLHAALEPAPSPTSPFRSALMWTGAGVAVAGLAITAVAIARASSDVSSFCVSRSDGSCRDTKAFATLGYNPNAAPSFSNDVNPSGILLAPLGYSLFAAGATWAGTTFLLDRDDPPWIELGIGLAVGIVAYGVSALVNSKSAFP